MDLDMCETYTRSDPFLYGGVLLDDPQRKSV